MAKFTYSPFAPFAIPPVGGSTLLLLFFPPTLPIFSITGTQIKLSGANDAILSFGGANFSARFAGDDFEVTGGRITSLTLRFEGRTIITATGLNLQAEVLFDFLQDGDEEAFILYLQRANDRVMGTRFDDTLLGLGGGDTIIGRGGADDLRGFVGRDVLFGGKGADELLGEAGKDRLFGGAGADDFIFEEAPGAANADMIMDFRHGTDTIDLSATAFLGSGPIGTLNPAAFRIGAVAVDASDRVIYQKSTGEIRFDADGAGGADARLFAKVTPGTTLTAMDFDIVPG